MGLRRSFPSVASPLVFSRFRPAQQFITSFFQQQQSLPQYRSYSYTRASPNDFSASMTDDDPIERLRRGAIRSLVYHGSAVYQDTFPPTCGPLVLLPGSFNPFHHGHEQLLGAATKSASASAGFPCYELAIENADKGVLDASEIRRRLQIFRERNLPLVLTRAPLFTQKAKLFPGATFVVGYDTATRLLMPKYYGNSFENMVQQFQLLHDAGCRFIVGGRVNDQVVIPVTVNTTPPIYNNTTAAPTLTPAPQQHFLTITDLSIPAEILALGVFCGLSEDTFRVDVSSTQLRNQGSTK